MVTVALICVALRNAVITCGFGRSKIAVHAPKKRVAISTCPARVSRGWWTLATGIEYGRCMRRMNRWVDFGAGPISTGGPSRNGMSMPVAGDDHRARPVAPALLNTFEVSLFDVRRIARLLSRRTLQHGASPRRFASPTPCYLACCSTWKMLLAGPSIDGSSIVMPGLRRTTPGNATMAPARWAPPVAAGWPTSYHAAHARCWPRRAPLRSIDPRGMIVLATGAEDEAWASLHRRSALDFDFANGRRARGPEYAIIISNQQCR